jgi:signal transduction histidine kinase
VTGWARRADGQIIPIQAWFSVYDNGDGRCLAAIVVDMSEEVRDRERENFQHLLDYNRLLAGAVSHEIRNFCSAISVVCANLSVRRDLRANADFDALVRLVDGLLGLASFELRHKSGGQQPRADLKSVVDQLRLVIEPDWEEIDGEVTWQVPEALPAVAADAHGLLQIFLNLCQNSLKAVEPMPDRRLTVALTSTSEDVVMTFSDSGSGVANPDGLFHLQPERPQNGGSGLGLYISRELARSFGGDLQHVPTAIGGEFRVVIPMAHTATIGEQCVNG